MMDDSFMKADYIPAHVRTGTVPRRERVARLAGIAVSVAVIAMSVSLVVFNVLRGYS